MIELKLRNIMKQLKSENPKKRFEALDQLFHYKMDEGIEVQIDVLKDMIKLAASQFPNSVDEWDNPSYYLIDFVCDFPMKEVVHGLLKHFDGFHLHAKERAIEFLLSTEDEGIFYTLEDKIVQLIQINEILLPIRELTNYPFLIKGILDQCLNKIKTPYYKYPFYELLLALGSSGVEKNYEKEIVLPILLEDFENAKSEYLKFDKEYNVDFVYKAWKDSYFVVRNRMRLLIKLMDNYFTGDTENELVSALSYNDPLIKTEALLVCIDKNLAVNKEIFIECAENIESAEMIYWELVDRNKEHLYPISEGKQQHLAKTRLFTYLINIPEEEDGQIHYSDCIEVIDKVETENAYSQPVRYYMMSFKEMDSIFIAWVGGYALEDGDDTAHMWDGTYTEFVELHSLSIEEHKNAFFHKRKIDEQNYESTTYFESSPKTSKGLWFLYALLISQWIRAFTISTKEAFLLPLAFTIIALVLTFIERRKNSGSRVALVGRKLVITKRNQVLDIELLNIKKIEYNKKEILIFNKKNKIEGKIPLKWVRYEQFYYFMKEHTNHLKEKPFIQE